MPEVSEVDAQIVWPFIAATAIGLCVLLVALDVVRRVRLGSA